MGTLAKGALGLGTVAALSSMEEEDEGLLLLLHQNQVVSCL
jgi:hypothetical protein